MDAALVYFKVLAPSAFGGNFSKTATNITKRFTTAAAMRDDGDSKMSNLFDVAYDT